MTAVLVTWLGVNWKAFLITAVVITVAGYLLAGVVPRTVERWASAKALIGSPP